MVNCHWILFSTFLCLKVESSGTQMNPAALTLKKDFTTLSDSLAGLKGSLQRLHAKCAADIQQAQSAHRKQQGDVNLLSANMLTLTQKIAEVEGLELTLIQLKREMESLNSKDGHHSTQLAAIVANINSVEGSLTAVRGEMREMQFNTTESMSGNSASSSQVSALYADISQLKQDMTDMKMKHVGYDGSIESLSFQACISSDSCWCDGDRLGWTSILRQQSDVWWPEQHSWEAQPATSPVDESREGQYPVTG